MMDPHLKKISDIAEAYFRRVPFNMKLDLDDSGFLILRSICEANGSTLIGKKVFLGGQEIADQVNFRFDGYYLQVAYRSIPHNQIIQKTIKV